MRRESSVRVTFYFDVDGTRYCGVVRQHHASGVQVVSLWRVESDFVWPGAVAQKTTRLGAGEWSNGSLDWIAEAGQKIAPNVINKLKERIPCW